MCLDFIFRNSILCCFFLREMSGETYELEFILATHEKYPDSWFRAIFCRNLKVFVINSQITSKSCHHYWWSSQWISISINKSQEFDLSWIVLNVPTIDMFFLIDANWLDSFFNCESSKEFRLSSDFVISLKKMDVGFAKEKHHFSFNANQLI